MKNVSKYTLVSRINGPFRRRVRIALGEPAGAWLALELAPDSYAIVDGTGAEVFCGDDLESFAREVGALRPDECIAR